MYETELDEKSASTPNISPLSLDQIPKEYHDDLQKVAESANLTQATTILNKISDTNPDVSNQLQSLVDQFQFEQILQLFKERE